MISRLSAMFAAIACAATLAVSPLAAQAQDQAASAAASAADTAPAPADIAPAAVAEAAPAKPVENPYSLGNIVAHGNVVDQAVLAILAIMSMGSWYILFTKLWDTSKIAREAKEVRATFSAKPGLESKRPSAATSIPNLFLAGDWTRSGWPATMEGAVRSGYIDSFTELLDEEERSLVSKITLERWHGAPDAGSWEELSELKIPKAAPKLFKIAA